MNIFPIGWTHAKLGELIFGFETGRNLKASANPARAGEIGVLKISAVTWGTFRACENKALLPGDTPYPQELVRSGDLLISRANTTELVGAPVLVDRDYPNLMLPDKILRVLYDERVVDRRFLLYALRSQAARAYIEANATGTSDSMRNLSQPKLREIPIALAPLAEQKRIADKLQVLLARVESCRSRLERAIETLKRFRQSILTAAMNGELTREWREERGLDLGGWTLSTVGRLIERIEAGHNVRCEERPPQKGEKGLVKISAVTWGTYDDNESKTLPRSEEVPERSRIRTGDFLISRANTLELVGACVIVDRVTRPVFLSDKILRLVMPEDWKPWLLFVLQSPTGRREIEARASGNQLSMRNLSQANLRELPVPIPSPAERAEIVRRTRSLLDGAQEIERRCSVELATVRKLTPLLLAKAFRGELVAQSTDDEHASELLAKAKIEKSAADDPQDRSPITPQKRPTMSNADKDAVKSAILKLNTVRFSFDELRAHVPGDYEFLKAALFELLEEPVPVVRQKFDDKLKAIRLVRVQA